MSTKLLPYVNSKTVSSIPDIQILEASSAYYEYSNLPNILLPGYDIKDWFDNHSSGESIILIDAGNYCYIDAYKDNSNQMHINIHYNNVLIGSFFQNVGEYPWIYLGVGVDDTNQLGYAVVLYRQGDDSNTKLRAYGICQSTSAQGNLYSLLRGAVPIPSNLSGGAGSGYIGSSLLSNKKMVGYNVPTSSAESTKTESVNEASETPVSGKPKIGNGFARIKFLRDVSQFTLKDIAKTLNTDHMQLYVNNSWWDSYQSAFAEYLGTNNILQAVRSGGSRIDVYDGENIQTNSKQGFSETKIWIPIQRTTISTVTITGYTTDPNQYRYGNVSLAKIQNGALVESSVICQLPASTQGTLTVNLDTPFEADYFIIDAGDGVLYANNISFM